MNEPAPARSASDAKMHDDATHVEIGIHAGSTSRVRRADEGATRAKVNLKSPRSGAGAADVVAPESAHAGKSGNVGGWASLRGQQGGESGDEDMSLSEEFTGEKGGGGKVMSDSRKGDGRRGEGAAVSKKLQRALTGDKNNRFSVLRDEGEGKGEGVRRDAMKMSPEGNRASKLLTADNVGIARRDMKAKGREEGGAGARKDALKVLRPLMSLNEWNKLSSAKQRKKMRKIAARDQKDELVRSVLCACMHVCNAHVHNGVCMRMCMMAYGCLCLIACDFACVHVDSLRAFVQVCTCV